MIIECDKCILRKWEPSDLESLVQNANNCNIASKMRDTFHYPYTVKEGKEWIKFAGNEEWGYNFAITVNNKAVGGIGLTTGKDIERKSSEVGYWLGEEHWGKGIVSSALKGMVKFAFKELKLERIFAVPLEHNIASRKVLEKNNFVLEGILRNSVVKSGKIYNQALYAKIKDNSV